MSRVLAIDYGEKRTGIAVTDPLRIIASALETSPTKELMGFMEKYLKEEQVEVLVIGHPKELNGKDCPLEISIQKFIKKFRSTYPKITIERIDERFTSKLALNAMIESGVKKKKRRDKGLVDQISAAIILQSYLNQSQK